MARNRDAFVRLANARVNKALESIRLVGNLSNKANYDYTDDDAQKILDALKISLAECRKRFELAGKGDKEEEFRLEL
jgi:hypothetical protein